MSYKPRKRVSYRLAAAGEIPDGRAIDIEDRPGEIEFVLHPDHAEEALCEQFARVTRHCVVHGLWRQRWTDDGRMTCPPQGLRLAVLRWERIPPDMMPAGRLIVPVEDDGWCVHLVDEDHCTRQLQNEMNDLLLRLAGDGLWIQLWFRRRPFPPESAPDPLLAPPALPMALV
ncbi:hypothetical protein [Streptomyces bottropensis]|uniref:hypothetical protein n=1 Tax=Streptomyces bottropensis TaxID=42235 RepID=UPI0036C143E3